MSKKIRLKLPLKILSFCTISVLSIMLLGNNYLLVGNNFANLMRSLSQERSVSFNFGYDRVATDTYSTPTWKRMQRYQPRRMMGAKFLYGFRYPNLIEFNENNGSIRFTGIWNDWYEGSMSNTSRYGPIGVYRNDSPFNNWLKVTQYSDTGRLLQDFEPTLNYRGEAAFDTLVAKTRSYTYNLNGFTFYTYDGPLILMLARVAEPRNVAFNQTNYPMLRIQANGTQHDYDYNQSLPFYFARHGGYRFGPNAYRFDWAVYTVAIFANDPLDENPDAINWYNIDDSTSYSVNFLENKLMPPEETRQEEIATTWLEDLFATDQDFFNFSYTNGTPQTYTGITGSAVADNLKGEIKFTFKTGILYEHDLPLDEINNIYSEPKRGIHKYTAKQGETTTFVVSGFKQVKKTDLQNANINNPYIQPQYVSFEEVKRLIYENCIIGDLPVGFTLDNIKIHKLTRSNILGTIQARVELTLFYDGNGDIKTRSFEPKTITISGFAKTNPSYIPDRIEIEEAYNILPTDVSADQIKDIIYHEIVERNLIYVPGVPSSSYAFPANFSKDDLIIKNEKINASNLTGTIRVNVMCKNFFNENGEITNIESNIGNPRITGFKSVGATLIPNDSYDFEDVTNSLYPTDVLAQPIYLKNFIATVVIPRFRLPDDFDADRDVELTNMVASNQSGYLSATVSLNNYYDGNGIPRQTGFEPRNIIFNFSKSIQPTILPDRINASTIGYGDKKPFELSEEDIKQIIVDNFIQGKPEDFNTSHVKFATVPQYNSSRKTIVVTPILTNWVDENGVFRTDPRTFNTITINNFAGSLATSFDTDRLIQAGSQNWVPTAAAEQIDLLKEIIRKNTKNAPVDFSVDNIDILEAQGTNTTGEVQVKVHLNYYNDDLGNPQTQGFDDQVLTIGYFLQAPDQTRLLTNVIEGDSEKLAQNYTNEELIQIVMENIDSVPPGFDESNISIENLDLDCLNGTIRFTPVINLWYDNYLSIQTEPKEFGTIIINNLKKTGITRINDSNLNLGDSKVYPSEFAEDYSNIINLIDSLIINPALSADDFDKNNDIVIQETVADDLTGTLTVQFILNSYFDEYGYLKNSGFEPKRLTFTGFNHITGATSIDATIQVDQEVWGNTYPFELTNMQVRQLIFDNLQNKVPGMTIFDVNLYNYFDVNNFNGSITTTPFIAYKYDDNGEIIKGWTTLNEVTFVGFKNAVAPTTMKTNNIKGDSNVLAQDAVKDIDGLKALVEQNISNPTPFFDRNSQMELQNISYDNILGNITFNLILKEIFDENGEIVSGQFNMGTITIFDYRKTSSYTSINNQITVEGANATKYAYELSINDIRQIIYDNVIHPPIELTLDEVKIDDDSIVINNKLGTIKLNATLNWTYDIYGNLINVPQEFRDITIIGFKQSSETIFKGTILSAKNIAEIRDLYPNELANNINLIKKVVKEESLNINSLPSDFSDNDIVVTSIVHNNYTGSVSFDISLKRYFDYDGVLQTNNSSPITITIVDLKYATGVTSILNVINYAGNDSATPTPYEVDDEKIKQLINDSIFSPAPHPGITDDQYIEFKTEPIRNNLNGTITVTPILKTSYDQTGNLVSYPVEFDEVKIVGLQVVTPTDINSHTISSSYNVLPSELQQEQIKECLLQELTSFPGEEQNIIINEDSIIANNLEGELSFNFVLDKYYDKAGKLVTNDNNFNPIWVTINNLKKVEATSLIKEKIDLKNMESTLPSELSDAYIEEYIKNNFSSLVNYQVDDFDLNTNLRIEVREKNNLNGEIIVELVLDKYYDNSGQLILSTETQDNSKTFLLTLGGFKSVQATSFNTEVDLSFSTSVDEIPQVIAEDQYALESIIRENFRLMINYLPDSFSIGNIVMNKVKSYDNLNGTITVQIGINNYYDKYGNYVNDPENVLYGDVVLNGFKNTSGTTITSKYEVQGYNFVIPTAIDDVTLTQIIKQNSNDIFSLLPPNALSNMSIENLSADNYQGTITANIILNSYYNENGDLITPSDNSPLVQQITLTNFKSSQATTIADNLTLRDQTNILASTITPERLKTLLYFDIDNLFSNLPPNFSIDENVDINIIYTNNFKGEIVAQVSLNKYFNELGNIVEAVDERDCLSATVLFSGFKKITNTTIHDSVYLPGVKNQAAVDVTSEQLINYIWDNKHLFFNNLPTDFTQDDLSINILSVDDPSGVIYVDVTISTYYNESEELIVGGNLSNEVKISGFKTYLSSNSSLSTIIAIGTVAGVLTVAFIVGLAFAFKVNRKRFKI